MAVTLTYDEDGLDFEPFEAFLSAAETTGWLRAWARNPALHGDAFRVFGQDGTGGYAAFWLTRQDQPLVEQPVVFLGSEGETGVVARNLDDFLWVLADGLGPYDAADLRERERPSHPHPTLTAIAERFAPDRRRPGLALIEAAEREFPDFDDLILGLCELHEPTQPATDLPREHPAEPARSPNEGEQATLAFPI